MDIKLHSTLNWLIVALLDVKSLPKTTCSYIPLAFLAIIIGIIGFPVLLVRRLVPKFNNRIIQRLELTKTGCARVNSNELTGFAGIVAIYVGIGLLTIMGGAILENWFSYVPESLNIFVFMFGFVVGTVFFSLLISVLVGLIWGIMGIGEWWDDRVARKSREKRYGSEKDALQKKTIVGQWLKSIKDKTCVQLTYIDENEIPDDDPEEYEEFWASAVDE